MREILWLKKFKDLWKLVVPNDGVDRMFNISIGEDNILCIKDAHILIVSEMSKHVDIKYQFLVDHVERGNVGLQF